MLDVFSRRTMLLLYGSVPSSGGWRGCTLFCGSKPVTTDGVLTSWPGTDVLRYWLQRSERRVFVKTTTTTTTITASKPCLDQQLLGISSCKHVAAGEVSTVHRLC